MTTISPEEIQKALNDKFAGLQSDLDQAKENGATKDEVKALEKSVKDVSDMLQHFIDDEKAAKNEGKTFAKAFEDFLVENSEELGKIQKTKRGEVEFIYDFKAVGAIGTGNGSTPVAAPANTNASLSRIRLRNDNTLLSVCTTVNTNSAIYPYTEATPKEGAFDVVTEGGTKPQIDLKWEVRYAQPYKIAAYEILSEEVVTDIPRMMSTAEGFLMDKHDLYKVNQVYFGTGLTKYPEGATVVGRLFNPATIPTKLPAGTANIMDVINACITDIYVTPNYADETPYMANVALMNPADFFSQFQAAKTGDGLSLYPQASLFDNVSIGGVAIKPWHSIPAGKIFVGDMSKYNLTNWVRYSVRIGWINDQFITNQFTMVGESRFHAFVKNLDRAAFIYDDIADIVTGIEAPAP